MKTYTTTQAAKELGINQSRVRQLILDGELPAEKFGHVWMIKATALNKFRVRRKSGKPSEQKGKSR